MLWRSGKAGGGDSRREACGRVYDEAARTATEERAVQRDEAFRLAGGMGAEGAGGGVQGGRTHLAALRRC